MRKLVTVLFLAFVLMIPFSASAMTEYQFNYEIGQQVTSPLYSADNIHVYNFTAYATQMVNMKYTCNYSLGNFVMQIYELDGAMLFDSSSIPNTDTKEQEIALVSGGKYQVVIFSADGRAAAGASYQFKIYPIDNDASGNTYVEAAQTNIGSTITGEITGNCDADFYKFTATGNETIKTLFFTNWKTDGRGWYRMKVIDTVTKQVVADSDLVLHPENSWGCAQTTYNTVSGRDYIVVVYSQDGASNSLPYQVLVTR